MVIYLGKLFYFMVAIGWITEMDQSQLALSGL